MLAEPLSLENWGNAKDKKDFYVCPRMLLILLQHDFGSWSDFIMHMEIKPTLYISLKTDNMDTVIILEGNLDTNIHWIIM